MDWFIPHFSSTMELRWLTPTILTFIAIRYHSPYGFSLVKKYFNSHLYSFIMLFSQPKIIQTYLSKSFVSRTKDFRTIY